MGVYLLSYIVPVGATEMLWVCFTFSSTGGSWVLGVAFFEAKSVMDIFVGVID